MKWLVPLVLALSAVDGSIEAAQGAQPAPAAPPSCRERPESRQFDFWIGEWRVVDRASGAVAGMSVIERLYGGCALRENWTGDGFRGGSLNAYWAGDHRWHQAWMDQAGAFRHFVGGLNAAGQMVLVAEQPDPRNTGGIMLIRMTFTANPDGTVRQYSDLSTDNGATWRQRYDYLYWRID